ncbi:MAG: DUF89 family protein [Chromatiales bacterium]|nr:DUF89 family protein [Chromatiales bacterium]
MCSTSDDTAPRPRAVFPLLASPGGYRACETDLLADARVRSHWLGVFRRQLHVQLDAARLCGSTEAQCSMVRREVLAQLEQLAAEPGRYGRLDILLIDQLRQRIFRRNGIADEMRVIKQRENKAALAALPGRLAELDALGDRRQRFPELVRGMLAGNLFDMGTPDTARLYANGSVPFGEALARVPSRPWLVDDVGCARNWLDSTKPARAVVLADNAGGDLLLGLMPFARELLRRGTAVVVAANSAPSHNDITHRELESLMPQLAEIDPLFGDHGLALVPNGSDAPLIDLCGISEELAAASVGADLVLLVGMGRALESNYSATFTVPVLRVAMVKDPEIARGLGGQLFDAVCRFQLPAVGAVTGAEERT